jgi:MFS family permease
MPAAHNFTGLLITRMLLGFFEAGVAPTFIAVTQMWWRRREQPVRLSAWYGTVRGQKSFHTGLATPPKLLYLTHQSQYYKRIFAWIILRFHSEIDLKLLFHMI